MEETAPEAFPGQSEGPRNRPRSASPTRHREETEGNLAPRRDGRRLREARGRSPSGLFAPFVVDRVGQFLKRAEMEMRRGEFRHSRRSAEPFLAAAALDPAGGIAQRK